MNKSKKIKISIMAVLLIVTFLQVHLLESNPVNCI